MARPHAVRHNLDPAAQEAAAAAAGGEAEEDEDDDSGSSAHWTPQRRCLPSRSCTSRGARILSTSSCGCRRRCELCTFLLCRR